TVSWRPCRTERLGRDMAGLIEDARHVLRTFRTDAAFTAMVLVAIVIGIGVISAVFTVVNAVLLAPLSVPEPDRTVFVMHTENGKPGPVLSSARHFSYWQTQTDTFEDLAAWQIVTLGYGPGDERENVTAAAVSEAYFRILGAPIVVGRSFLPDEDVPGARETVVLSHRFW